LENSEQVRCILEPNKVANFLGKGKSKLRHVSKQSLLTRSDIVDNPPK